MPVGPRPVLELVLQWLRRNGVSEVFITTGYLGILIRTACGDGRKWGLTISTPRRPSPSETIGPLRMLRKALTEPFLVDNGDRAHRPQRPCVLAMHKAHEQRRHHRDCPAHDEDRLRHP